MADSETRACQNCKVQFTIEPEDFEFYKKLGVPAPTFCWRCRMQRRVAIRNERSLYKRTCQLCSKETISVYSPDKDLTVYCPECYRSDRWDPLSYGREYDFSTSLFEQLNRLFREVPRPAVNETNVVNCSYCEDCINSKNCYLVFGGYNCDNVQYSYTPIFSRNCVDVTFVNQCEMAYEASNSYGLYATSFAHVADECLDSAFLYDCKGVKKCFGGINLRNKSYYIFNKAYSKKEYEAEIKKWDIGSYATLQRAHEKFRQLYLATPRRWAITKNAVDVSGNNISNAKNCHYCFSVTEACENLKYVFMAGLAFKDSYDAWAAGEKSQLLYEVTGSIGGERVLFTNNTHHCVNVQYSNKCFHCQDLFGCVGLRKKNYCILNKQYPKGEYYALVNKIIEQAKQVPYVDGAGRRYLYGEFFPIEHMPMCYNESIANERFPLTREQAAELKYPWYEEPERRYAVTMQPGDLPDHINDVPDSIVNEIIACEHRGSCQQKCTTAFRITSRELEFYRQLKVALPRLCPNCRHAERDDRRNGMIELHERGCQCAGELSEKGTYKNTAVHAHGTAPCSNRFASAFAPSRQEIVYCEQCYQDELV
jgi:hypothetical protein